MAMLGHPVLLGTAVVAVTVIAAATITAKRRSRLPEVSMQQSEFNRAVLSRCPTLNAVYRVLPFLTNG